MNRRQFNILSAVLIPFALVIILWGAWVRISGSGDGCGVHWPLCQGGIFPSGEYLAVLQTWIEYFHRAKSGLFGILVALQCFFAFKLFPRRSAARFFAVGTFIFTVIEALLGALLVLGSFVGTDASTGRIVVMSFHLANTLVLLAFLYGAYFFSKESYSDLSTDVLLPTLRRHKHLLVASLLLTIVSIAGAWAALATTLFPSTSLMEGLAKDLDAASHILLKIRIIHPILAVAAAFGVFFLTYKAQESAKNYIISILLAVQLCFGVTTLALLSPVWMKIVHLLLADLLWLALIHLLFRQNKSVASI